MGDYGISKIWPKIRLIQAKTFEYILLVCVCFSKRNLSHIKKKKKKQNKTRPFLDLYTKTHLWAYISLEKRGGLECTRNGSNTRF